ncbi:MAG: family 16 glycoside hydrolase [Mariniblastus sp.]
MKIRSSLLATGMVALIAATTVAQSDSTTANDFPRLPTAEDLPVSTRLPTVENMHLIDDVEDGFTALFDGKTLEGWEQKNGTATYEVVDGTIKGVTAKGSPNSFLCTKKEFADFDLRFDVKVHDKLNSGVQIRSVTKADFKKGRVHGPQVEIEADPGESGYVYSEGTGRGWISPTQTIKNAFKNGEWNSYRIVADGSRIQTWINGIYIEDLDCPPVESMKGFLGLQVHGIGKQAGPYDVYWRNIRIKELTGSEARSGKAMHGTPTVDGKIDDIWKDVPRMHVNRSIEEHDELSGDEKPSTAWVKCLWDDGHLYCLAEVTDQKIATDADEDWQKDSVEFFVDANLSRSDTYDADDGQYRTDAAGGVSCGDNNDLSNYKSAVTKTETGYIVEACIKLNTRDGLKAGSKIGFDAQVNNDTGTGQRSSTTKWNDDSNQSFENLSDAGTLELIGK